MGGPKKQHDRGHQGHTEELAAIQFIEAALFKNELPEKEDVTLCETRLTSRLQLKPGDHSRLDHPGTGMRTTSPEVSRCCIQVFQAADSGRLLCERDQ